MIGFEDLKYNGRSIPDFPKSDFEYYQWCLAEFPETTDEAYEMMYEFLCGVNSEWAEKFSHYKIETKISEPPFMDAYEREIHESTRTIARCLQNGFTEESIYDAFCVEGYELILQRHKMRKQIEEAPKERPPTEHIPEGPYKIELKGEGKPLFRGMEE